MTEFVELSGNIFSTQSQAIVITVNCEGVMGAGIALDAKLRWPKLFKKYIQSCSTGEIAIGKSILVRRDEFSLPIDVILFATKNRWRNPSTLSYIRDGLTDLRSMLEVSAIESIALPHLGCSNGGLQWAMVRPLIENHLYGFDKLRAELWKFVDHPNDPHIHQLRDLVRTSSPREVAKLFGIQIGPANSLIAAMQLEHVGGLSSLQRAPGVGEKTLAAVYGYLFPTEDGATRPVQGHLPL
jgi:O-acetyl-ADP-ribose deacetylase (regulator of RNase III)